MNMLSDMLAAGHGSDAVEFIVILVTVVIIIIGNLIKKGMESAKKQQADAARRQGYRPPADASQEEDGNEPLPPVTRKTNADRLYEQARHRRQEYEQQKTFGHSVMQQGGGQPAQPLAPAAHKNLVAGSAAAEQTRVEQELQRLRIRQQKLEAQRAKRLSLRGEPYNETTQAIETRVLHVPAAQMETAQAAGPATGLHLMDPHQAKAAIVFHEIFSPPKALRGEAEMWDM